MGCLTFCVTHHVWCKTKATGLCLVWPLGKQTMAAKSIVPTLAGSQTESCPAGTLRNLPHCEQQQYSAGKLHGPQLPANVSPNIPYTWTSGLDCYHHPSITFVFLVVVALAEAAWHPLLTILFSIWWSHPEGIQAVERLWEEPGGLV
jgi:hypothetical protein